MPDEDLFDDNSIEFLNLLAKNETHSRKPIYRIHKWWARRLSCVFRMIILSTLMPSLTPDEVWKKYYSNYDLGGKIILDPFMGGGTVVVEALKLGCSAIGSDINPLAWFITKKEIEDFQREKLLRAFSDLERSSGKFIRSLYTTHCPAGHLAEIIHVIWCTKAPCYHCNQEINLVGSYIVQKVGSKYVVCCPNCLTLVHASELGFPTTCPSCFGEFDPNKGSVKAGYATCPKCNHKQNLGALVKKRESISEQILAIEYYCPICGKGLKPPNSYDESQYQKAKKILQIRGQELIYPRDTLRPSSSRETTRLKKHGFNYYYQLFNHRQLLCLSLLFEEIIKIEDQSVKEYLLIAFSDCLSTNNLLCRYEAKYGKVGSIFGFQSYHFIPRYGENNVWGGRFGRGTFSKCFRKLLRGKQYAKCTYDFVRLPWGKVKAHTGSAIAHLIDDFEQLFSGNKRALVGIQDALDLSHIPSDVVDAIITDPPYLDTIVYSELADFFYVWLRIALKETYPAFHPKYSSRNNEMIMHVENDASKQRLQNLFLKSLKECARVLKPNGVLVLTFHHVHSWAWAILANALSKSGFVISKRSVVRSEGRGGFPGKSGAIKSDACFVCRQGPPNANKSLQRIIKDTSSYASMIVQRLKSTGVEERSTALFVEMISKLVQEALSSEEITQTIGEIHSTASWLDEALMKVTAHLSDTGALGPGDWFVF